MKRKIENQQKLEILDSNEKICIMGIGNFDRADDFAGIEVIEQLLQFPFPKNILLLNAGSVPESFTSKIKKHRSKFLVIIDALMMNEKPGTIRIFSEEELNENYLITPHKTSMQMYMKYLRYFLANLQLIFIGIQPYTIEYGKPLSNEVKSSVIFLSNFLGKFLKINMNKE